MKKIVHLIFFLSFFCTKGFAETIYVDQNLSSSCSDGDYSITNRNCSGSDGNAYSTIQAAFSAMVTGDTIYLRGGNYNENFGNSYTAIQCPSEKNGDSWEQGHFNTIASFPGEWAVLDGSSNNKYCTIGRADSGHGTSDLDLAFWKFERLEVTGGNKGGFGIWGGPVIIRYCYIHDNGDGTYNENPCGIRTYHLKNSTIEYNWLKDNGGMSGVNQAHISIFNDYNDCYSGVNISGREVPRNNEIKYNYLEGNSFAGIRHKGNGQRLTDEQNPSLVNRNLASKWHHNYIKDSVYAVQPRIDFIQVYNNICDGGAILLYAQTGSGIKQAFYQVAYNNTFIEDGQGTDHASGIWSTVGYGPATYCGIAYPVSSYHPRLYIFNNIVAGAVSSWNFGHITVGSRMASGSNNLNSNDLIIERNLIYEPQDNDHILIGRGLPGNCDYDEGGCTASEYNNLYDSNNYTSSNSGLFTSTSGSSRFKVNPNFNVATEVTIANGGGGNHPYFSDVTIPPYVGAVNPNDSDWVDGVLGLASVSALQSSIPGGGDPSWVESAWRHIVPDPPSNLRVVE